MNGVTHGQGSHVEGVQVVERTEAVAENGATAVIPATAHQVLPADLIHLPNHQALRQLHVANVSTHNDQKNA